MLHRILLSFCIVAVTCTVAAQSIYEAREGSVKFRSKAPKELISAASGKLNGVLDMTTRNFAFRINVSSFEGFNSPLQREHFNENYMETSSFPLATFAGKIIEDIDLGREGTYEVRAKGKLIIHGVEQERIIKCNVTRVGNRITVDADFVVLLADYSIKIPRIVHYKLASEINVNIHAVLTAKR